MVIIMQYLQILKSSLVITIQLIYSRLKLKCYETLEINILQYNAWMLDTRYLNQLYLSNDIRPLLLSTIRVAKLLIEF